MRKGRLAALLLLLALLCGCAPQAAGPEAAELDRLLDAQLGKLVPLISREERQAARDLLAELQPVQARRLERGKYEKTSTEVKLLQELNALYDAYTVRYLNPEEEAFDYQEPPWKTVARYDILEDGTLTPTRAQAARAPEEPELFALWEQIWGWLPEDAFERFDQITFFTDGEYETLAYAAPLDSKGARWEFGVDPADAEEEELFLETVLHEYFHSLTLNEEQVKYTGRQTLDTYNEEGMVSLEGSYLNAFYQAFWTDYLDDCLTCEDTYNFFLRHEEDFVTPYASTDPSEDICESLTFFVLWPGQEGDAVWERKLQFFEAYPELVDFRRTVRDNLGLEP